MIAAGAHLVLEHDDALGAEARDDVDIAAEAVRLLGLRPRDGAAGAAADDHDLVHVVKLGGIAERADNVGHIVAGLLAGELRAAAKEYRPAPDLHTVDAEVVEPEDIEVEVTEEPAPEE